MKMRIDQRGRMVSMDFRTFAVLAMLSKIVIDNVDDASDLHIALGSVLSWAADDREVEEINAGARRFCDSVRYAGEAVSPHLVKSDHGFCMRLNGTGKFLQSSIPVFAGSIGEDGRIIEQGDDDA